MFRKIIIPFLVFAVAVTLLSGCNKWDDHVSITDEGVGNNLYEQITANTDLSKFADLLSKTGYSDSLAASKTFTVYAPTNASLTNLGAIENDAEALKQFVANHIARQTYFTSATAPSIRIPVLTGKYHNVTPANVDGVPITTKDVAAKNGVIQVIGGTLPVLGNVWDFVSTDARMPALQKVTMIDSFASQFRSRVQNLSNESKNYTLFVLQDAAWQSELNTYKRFYQSGTADSTANYASWAIVRDFAVDTLYNYPAAIPDTILSRFNVKLGIDKSSIVETVKTSNGIVYIMSRLPVAPRSKFPDYIIEGENYLSTSASRPNNIYIRDKVDSTGKMFRDVLAYNHGLAQFNFRYRLTEVPSGTYKVYWMALNDNINGMTAPFQQKIGVDSFNSPTPAYMTVELNRYAEQYAGEFTLSRYKPSLNIYLVAANSTSANANAIVCNYIRLVPQF